VVINNYEENVGHDLLDYMHIFERKSTVRPWNYCRIIIYKSVFDHYYIKLLLPLEGRRCNTGIY
jgi:hypothetical protein